MDLEVELKTWRAWISKPIHDEIATLVLGRQIWRRYSAIVDDAHPQVRESGGEFHRWVRRNHAQAIGSGIRRQADVRPDVVGLARLLDRMARYPRALTFERYVETGTHEDEGDRLRRWAPFAVDGGGMLDPTVPAIDLEDLRIELAPILRWVNKTIAHHDHRKVTVEEELGITFQTLHEAVDYLITLFNRYSLLLTHTYVSMDDIITDPWEYAFHFKWVNEPTYGPQGEER